ncbi:MAG: hypothetical protein CFE24_01095 [Flavobacterium sp. BFFFF2]|nr:MAG: hypothetical protein CFE24_01095 [Flavobacterium sp. BFFFF2]
MDHIYIFLNNVWLKAKNNAIEAPFFFLIALLLGVIPFHYRYMSIVLMSIALFSLLTYWKKRTFVFCKNDVWPIALYLWMVLSWFWSIDQEATWHSLSKELSFLIIPILFALNRPFLQKNIIKLFQWFGCFFVLFAVFRLFGACFRYVQFGSIQSFFYHNLVGFDANAVHISQLAVWCFFSWLIYPPFKQLKWVACVILGLFILLLSSRNAILVWVFLLCLYGFLYFKGKWRGKKLLPILAVVGLFVLVFVLNVKNRFSEEWAANFGSSKYNAEMSEAKGGVINNVTAVEAWNTPNFQQNDYFSGTVLRVYLIRIFVEFEQENSIFWQGFGQDASGSKMVEKQQQHSLYEEYKGYNFHNQYVQTTAELGIVGLLILLLMLATLTQNAIKNKDFLQFVFAVLMISLFLTESFLARQRGIVFFTTLYVFYSSYKPSKTNT